jgi:hypothetical protein
VLVKCFCSTGAAEDGRAPTEEVAVSGQGTSVRRGDGGSVQSWFLGRPPRGKNISKC